MDALFRQPLFYIYFLYTGSFLVMAYVIFRGIRTATSLALVTTFQTLAVFGLVHGIAEMTDWARLILETTGHAEIPWLNFLADLFDTLSFVVLLLFAVNLLSYRSERKNAYRLLAGLLVTAGIVALVARNYDIHQVALSVRRSCGFAGALLGGVAFCKLAIVMRSIGNARVEAGLVLGALGFSAYSVFGGLIVTTVAGQPVEIFRALCAFTIVVASTLTLGIFRQAES